MLISAAVLLAVDFVIQKGFQKRTDGRRIDIETLKRSIPLRRSDYQCPANHDVVAAQCHTAALSSWTPYHGTSVGRIVDLYRFRSCYTTALGDNFIYSATENLGNIKPDCDYEFTDADSGEKEILSGRELSENGFALMMSEKHTARVIFVKKL